MHQIEIVSLDSLVQDSHVYRKFNQIWSFKNTETKLRRFEKNNPHKGYGLLRLFKCLLLQFMEDLSDRELEKFLQENTAGKWFCGFTLTDKTPGHSVFSKMRKRLGTKLLSNIFSDLRAQLKQHGVMNEVFSFIDASHLIAKAALWTERDNAIKMKHRQLNNAVLPKVAYDKQARIGCKGKRKYWYGYKKHACVDMQSGLMNKVAITPANVTDSKGMKHVCPGSGAIYADKGYCDKHSKKVAAQKECYLRAIKKNNMKDKNRDFDRWVSHLRSPYERVFSQQNKRVRYRGVAKNQFSAFMEAIFFNLKRLVALDLPNICLD